MYDGSFVQSINKYGLKSSRILYPLSKDLSVSIYNEKNVSEKKTTMKCKGFRFFLLETVTIVNVYSQTSDCNRREKKPKRTLMKNANEMLKWLENLLLKQHESFVVLYEES